MIEFGKIEKELKQSLSQRDLERYDNANFQEWFLLKLYKEAKEPKMNNFVKAVIKNLNDLENSEEVL